MSFVPDLQALRDRIEDRLASTRDQRTGRLDDLQFRVLFASYLQRRPNAWRRRRTDSFTPLFIDSAQRTITLQGRISLDALAEFADDLERGGGEKAIVDAARRVAPADNLYLFLPFARFAKQVTVGFSARDAAGNDTPVLPRHTEAIVTSAHLLSLLQNESALTTTPTDDELRGVTWILAALVATRIHDLETRIDCWDDAKELARWHTQQDNELLAEWIEREVDEIFEGAGPLVATMLSECLCDGPDLSLFGLDRKDTRINGLCALVLFACHDLFQIMAERDELLRGPGPIAPSLVVERVERFVVPGLRHFVSFAESLSQAGCDLLGGALTFWTTYLACEVPIGRPFIFSTTELLALPSSRTFGVFTAQAYPLPIGDTQSLHIEVACGDLELEIAKSKAHYVRTPDGTHQPTHEAFYSSFTASTDVAHFYLSQRVEDSSVDGDPVDLWVRFRLSRLVVLGYVIAAISILFAGGWVGWEWVRPAWRIKAPPKHEDTLLLLSAAFAAFPLWLTGVQHKKPFVHQKLRNFRVLIGIGLLLPIALSAFAWGLRSGHLNWLDHHHPQPKPAQHLRTTPRAKRSAKR